MSAFVSATDSSISPAAPSTAPPGTQSPRRPLLLFLLVLSFTAFWIGLNVALPGLQATGIPTVGVRVVLHAIILAGLWLALRRTDLDSQARVRTWLAIAVPFTIWLALVWWLAAAGRFQFDPNSRVPALPIAVLGPMLLLLPLLLRSKRVGAILDATPAAWLVGLQAYRVFGSIFLVLWSRGEMPGVFALPAGGGDVLVGLLALPVASLLAAGAPGSRMLAIAWNLLGILDLANAVGLGIVTATGPLQLIVPDQPNLLLGAYPTVMTPAFAVPSSIILHGLSLRQLRRLGRRPAEGPAPGDPVRDVSPSRAS